MKFHQNIVKIMKRIYIDISDNADGSGRLMVSENNIVDVTLDSDGKTLIFARANGSTFSHSIVIPTITIDSEFNTGSENPVQNKVIAQKINEIVNSINGITENYLTEADKTELSNAITEEANRAKSIEGGLETRLATVESDYLVGADKTELQGKIDDNAEVIAAVKEDVDAFFKDADLTENAKDTLKELQSYIASDETAASEMLASIQQNSRNIESLEGRMSAAEGDISVNEQAISTLQNEDSAIKGRLDSIEDIIGNSTSIADDIEKAKQAAIEAARVAAENGNSSLEASLKKYVDDEDAKVESRVDVLETNTSAMDGRLSAAEAQIALNKAAHEANAIAISARALQTDLEGVSGRVTTLENWHNNFSEATEEDIQNLFITTTT